MRAELVNRLEGCPADCPDADIEVERVYSRHWCVTVLVDCAHSGVCRFRREVSDGDEERGVEDVR